MLTVGTAFKSCRGEVREVLDENITTEHESSHDVLISKQNQQHKITTVQHRTTISPNELGNKVVGLSVTTPFFVGAPVSTNPLSEGLDVGSTLLADEISDSTNEGAYVGALETNGPTLGKFCGVGYSSQKRRRENRVGVVVVSC